MVKSKCILFHLAWAERRKYEPKKRKKKQISIIVRNIEKKNKEAYRKADRERKKLSRKSLKYLQPKKYQLTNTNRERKRNEGIDLAIDNTDKKDNN